MQKIFTLFIILILPLAIFAQTGYPAEAGAKGTAMGGASVTQTDGYASITNPAGMAFWKDKSFGVALGGQRRFLSEALNDAVLGGGYAFKNNAIGLMVQYFGFKNYNEQKIGLSYARKLFKSLSLGLRFDYLGVRIPEYGPKGSVTFDMGLMAQPSSKIKIGAHVYSPMQIKLTDDGDKIATELRMGAAWLPTENITTNFEVAKTFNYPASFRAGIDYRVAEPLFIRAGIRTQPTQASFGFGILLKKSIHLDFASAWHQQLGFTPSFSFVYHR